MSYAVTVRFYQIQQKSNSAKFRKRPPRNHHELRLDYLTSENSK